MRVHPQVPLAHPLDDGSAVVLHRSLNLTGQGLGADGAAYQRLFAKHLPAQGHLTGGSIEGHDPTECKKMPLPTINPHVTARALIFSSDTGPARSREQTCLLPWSILRRGLYEARR